MRKTPLPVKTNPRHRVLSVTAVLSGSSDASKLDAWENKLLNIYKLRAKFKNTGAASWYSDFCSAYPLYGKLLDTYESTEVGSLKQLIEAALLTSVDCKNIADGLDLESVDPLFLGLYRELFFDVVPILGNPALEFLHIISPMVQCDSDKLAIGEIWKLLALAGGLQTLKRKGFGTEAVKAEDIMYILQLASFRNCSMLLKYVGVGSEFFKDNPAAVGALSTIAELDSVRGSGRRLDCIAELSSVAKNNLSVLLSEGIKLLNVPDSEIVELVELDGKFSIDNPKTIEITNHINFLDNSESEYDA